jgi:hypothetical protein
LTLSLLPHDTLLSFDCDCHLNIKTKQSGISSTAA